MAAFNFDKVELKTKIVSIDRLGLKSGSFSVHDLWTGSNYPFEGDLKLTIPPMDCQLICLTKVGE